MRFPNKKTPFPKDRFPEPKLPAREEKIRQTVAASMGSFLEAQTRESMNIWEFLYCQSRYVKKHWWLLQALLLLWLYSHIRTYQDPVLIRRTLGVGAPLFIILVIPELWKNQSSNAMDIESATMYTLQQLYSARLTLFAGVDLLLLSVFCLGTTVSLSLTFWDLLTQFVLPVNMTCCICLTCLYTPRGVQQAFSLALCLAFAGIWREIVSNETLYQAITIPTWAGLLVLSLGYMVYCVLRGQKRWRRDLEKKLLWD